MRDRRLLSDAELATVAHLWGKTVMAVRVVICGRPYARDVVLDLNDGSSVTFCSEYDEDVVIASGDHGIR